MKKILFLAVFISITINSVNAFPPFLKKYTEHPRAKQEFTKDCSLCHLSPNGGGERTEFGKEFAREGAEITKELIEKYPSKFN